MEMELASKPLCFLKKHALDKVQKNKECVCLLFMLYSLLSTLGNAGLGLAWHGLVWHGLVGPFIHEFKTASHIKDQI